MPRMPLRVLLAAAAVLALAPAAAARAADTTVVADPAAEQVAALGGTLVWVSGKFGSQTLMQRLGDGSAAQVPGTPTARSYPSIDLGRNVEGDVVLTYLQCRTPSHCTALRDDLGGHHHGIHRPRGCQWATVPAIWRARTAYGLACRRSVRSGLFVKKVGSPARRLRRPKDAVKFGSDFISAV